MQKINRWKIQFYKTGKGQLNFLVISCFTSKQEWFNHEFPAPELKLIQTFLFTGRANPCTGAHCAETDV